MQVVFTLGMVQHLFNCGQVQVGREGCRLFVLLKLEKKPIAHHNVRFLFTATIKCLISN